MWKGYEWSLLDYYFKIIDEWILRGYHISDKTIDDIIRYYQVWMITKDMNEFKIEKFEEVVNSHKFYTDKIDFIPGVYRYKTTALNAPKPKWVFDKQTLDGFRSNLIRKNPDHYRKFWPDIPDNLTYTYAEMK